MTTSNDELSRKIDLLSSDLNEFQQTTLRLTRQINTLVQRVGNKVDFLEGKAVEKKIEELLDSVALLASSMANIQSMLLEVRTVVEGVDNRVQNTRTHLNNKLDALGTVVTSIQNKVGA